MKPLDHSSELKRKLAKQERCFEEKLKLIQQSVSENLHELKTPVAIIKGYLEILEVYNEQGSLENNLEQEHYYLNKIKMQVHELEAILTYLSQATKVTEINREYNFISVEITGFIQAIINQFEALFLKKQIHLDYNFPENKIFCDLDEEHFRHVIQNIIHNAIKYTPENGIIKITAEQFSEDGQDQIRISISDNGQGLSTEECKNIFDRYFTTNTDSSHFSQSSGIGLSLAKKIVDYHNGKIWAVSSEESGKKGLSIFITLPLHQK